MVTALYTLGQIVPKYQEIILPGKRISNRPVLGTATRTGVGSPKGEISVATISTRIPHARSPLMVRTNSPQAAVIRARMLNTPADSERSKVSTHSTSDSNKTKEEASIFNIIRMIATPCKMSLVLPICIISPQKFPCKDVESMIIWFDFCMFCMYTLF